MSRIIIFIFIITSFGCYSQMSSKLRFWVIEEFNEIEFEIPYSLFCDVFHDLDSLWIIEEIEVNVDSLKNKNAGDIRFFRYYLPLKNTQISSLNMFSVPYIEFVFATSYLLNGKVKSLYRLSGFSFVDFTKFSKEVETAFGIRKRGLDQLQILDINLKTIRKTKTFRQIEIRSRAVNNILLIGFPIENYYPIKL